MIPEFMSEVLLILELGVEEAHEFDHGKRVRLSSLPIFDGQHVIDQFLHVPAVFPHFQMVAGGIVLHNFLGWNYEVTSIPVNPPVRSNPPALP